MFLIATSLLFTVTEYNTTESFLMRPLLLLLLLLLLLNVFDDAPVCRRIVGRLMAHNFD